MSVAQPRLPAAERREALIETAIKVFAAGSYRGVTTAEIAKAAGVSEPILYRHFGSKRELYLAAVERVWCELRKQWADVIAAEPDPARWFFALTSSGHSLLNKRTVLGALWVQALAEASEDPELRKYLRTHLREVHAYVSDVFRNSQAAGGLVAERDAAAEAWVFLAGSLLATVGRRIGLLDDEDFGRIRAARIEWLSGKKPNQTVPYAEARPALAAAQVVPVQLSLQSEARKAKRTKPPHDPLGVLPSTRSGGEVKWMGPGCGSGARSV